MKTLELRTFFVLLFFSAVIFLLDSRGLLDAPKSIVQTIVMPVQYLFKATSDKAEEAVSFLTFWRSGEERIKNLELRVMELQGADAKAKNLENENTELRKQLGVNGLKDQKMLPAVVLGTNRYFEIAAGSSGGAAVGQTVVYLNNFVGTIVKVTPKVSYVQLPTDPKAKVPVKVNKASGLISGQFNSSIILDRIAQTEEISENDYVLTSGEGNQIAPNLLVGKIKKIVSLETDLFKKAEIQPLVDYKDLTTVFVLL